MKTAICISGQPRQINEAYDNIKKNLIDPYSPDIFIHLWLDPINMGQDLINSWGKNVGEVEYGVLSNVYDKYKPKKIKVENQIPFKHVDNLPKEVKEKNENYHFNMVSMLYSINEANNLKIQYEIENEFKYDIVVRNRFDLELRSDINLLTLNLNEKIYCLKDCPYYNGVNDQFAVGNSENMDILSSTYKDLGGFIKNYQHYTDVLCGETCVYHTTWIRNKIPIEVLPTDYKILTK
mgnify:FL=1